MPDDRIDTAYRVYQELEALAHLKAQSPFVPGDGPLRSPVLIIGEAPGPREIEQLRPFTGPAGRHLDQMLAAAGIQRRLCRVTNAVKYMPRDSSGHFRRPFYPEISAGVPCLLTEIAVTRPYRILAMGATALKALDPRLALSEIHGKLTTRHLGSSKYTILPLYHPSFCLRDGDADAAVRIALAHLKGSHESRGNAATQTPA